MYPSGLGVRPLLSPSLVAGHLLNESFGSSNTLGEKGASSCYIQVLLGSTVKAMEEVLDDQPLFHAMVGAGCDIFLESFPRLRHRPICELLKARDAIPQSTSLPEWEVLGEEGIGTQDRKSVV